MYNSFIKSVLRTFVNCLAVGKLEKARHKKKKQKVSLENEKVLRYEYSHELSYKYVLC